MITIQGEIGNYIKVPEYIFVNGLEYEAGEWTPSSNVKKGEIQFSKTHTNAPSVVIVATTDTSAPHANQALEFVFLNWEKIVGHWIKTDSTPLNYGYGSVYYTYSNLGGSVSSSRTLCTKSGDAATDYTYVQYYADNEACYPQCGYTSGNDRLWRSDTTYKWLAIWYPEN